MPSSHANPSFKSFFMAGFECTYCLNEFGERLDLLAATQHDTRTRQDYRMLKEIGISTVREGLAWYQIDQGGGTYDFSRFQAMMDAAAEQGIEQIWDLNHFDIPEYVDPWSDDFPRRFAEYAVAAARVIRRHCSGTMHIVPVNETSFFSWIASERGVWAPFATGGENGLRFKQQLVRAALAAMDAIWELDENARFIHVDPFMRRVARRPANPAAIAHTRDFNDTYRYEAWDMIAGRAFPELGGDPKYLDVIGVNYYGHNQEWVLSRGQDGIAHRTMAWTDRNRIPFWVILEEIYHRYGRPMVVTETGSHGDRRPAWWERTLREVSDGLMQGLPVCGLCAYPILDRPSWLRYLEPQSGWWDFKGETDLARYPNHKILDIARPYIAEWNR